MLILKDFLNFQVIFTDIHSVHYIAQNVFLYYSIFFSRPFCTLIAAQGNHPH